mgnify:CR=1 FL=1
MFRQVELRYPFNALEPNIDEKTMIVHYTRLYANYTTRFNAALEKLPQLQGMTVQEILSNLNSIEDDELRTQIRRNGGGYYNHSLYFTIMSPKGGGAPSGLLAKQINKDFDSFDNFVQNLTEASMSVFGSGYSWVSVDKEGSLKITTTPNQDNPLMYSDNDLKPIMLVDVWEHAYFLRYLNLRANYIKAFFNVVDWDVVLNLYLKNITARDS